MSLNIDAYLLCYNESRIIEHTLNYYVKFCNKITIIDNQSTDNSIEILKTKFPEIIIQELDTDGKYREDVLMSIRNSIWKNSEADFVIMADMDEIIYDYDHDILDKLNEMKEKGIAIPKVTGYNMYSEKFPDDYNISIINQVSDKVKDKNFDKNIIFNPKLVKEMNFGPGSHYCKPVFNEEVNKLKQVNHSFELSLLHFKYLDREYLYEKHNNYCNRNSNINRFYGYGFEYNLGNKYVDIVFDKIEKKLKIE
jgi:hypothetical protein